MSMLSELCLCAYNLYTIIFLRDNRSTLQDKEIDDNDGELDSSQPPPSSQGKLVDDKEILHVGQTRMNEDIEEFDSD